MNEFCFSHYSIYELIHDLDFQDPIWDYNYIKISIIDNLTTTENCFVSVFLPELYGCEISIYWLLVPTADEKFYAEKIIQSETNIKRFIFKK